MQKIRPSQNDRDFDLKILFLFGNASLNDIFSGWIFMMLYTQRIVLLKQAKGNNLARVSIIENQEIHRQAEKT